ncbi:hypothetical protein pb186bvf_014470 [Paramecium bursaria]
MSQYFILFWNCHFFVLKCSDFTSYQRQINLIKESKQVFHLLFLLNIQSFQLVESLFQQPFRVEQFEWSGHLLQSIIFKQIKMPMTLLYIYSINFFQINMDISNTNSSLFVVLLDNQYVNNQLLQE